MKKIALFVPAVFLIFCGSGLRAAQTSAADDAQIKRQNIAIAQARVNRDQEIVKLRGDIIASLDKLLPALKASVRDDKQALIALKKMHGVLVAMADQGKQPGMLAMMAKAVETAYSQVQQRLARDQKQLEHAKKQLAYAHADMNEEVALLQLDIKNLAQVQSQ